MKWVTFLGWKIYSISCYTYSKFYPWIISFQGRNGGNWLDAPGPFFTCKLQVFINGFINVLNVKLQVKVLESHRASQAFEKQQQKAPEQKKIDCSTKSPGICGTTSRSRPRCLATGAVAASRPAGRPRVKTRKRDMLQSRKRKWDLQPDPAAGQTLTCRAGMRSPPSPTSAPSSGRPLTCSSLTSRCVIYAVNQLALYKQTYLVTFAKEA